MDTHVDCIPRDPSVQCSHVLSGDRTRPFHTKLAVNQGYLNQIATPPEVAVLAPVFEKLAQLQADGKLPPWAVSRRP